MDRFHSSESERFAAMRTGWLSAIELLLRAGLRERTKPAAAPPDRRALYAPASLRQPPSASGAEARCRVRHQPQTHSTTDEHSRAGGDLSQAASESAGARPRDPPVSAARRGHSLGQPGLEQRYYLRIPMKEIGCSDPMSIRIRAQRSWQFYVDGLIDIRQEKCQGGE